LVGLTNAAADQSPGLRGDSAPTLGIHHLESDLLQVARAGFGVDPFLDERRVGGEVAVDVDPGLEIGRHGVRGRRETLQQEVQASVARCVGELRRHDVVDHAADHLLALEIDVGPVVVDARERPVFA
jgi:hypothetical protein